MKKLALVTLVTAGLLTTGAAYAAMPKSLENNLVKICKALQSDSKLRLSNTLKRTGISYRSVADGLVCNGKNAVDFAMSHNAEKTAYIVTKKGRVQRDAALAKR